mgnify:CR=1 FL=1
MYIVCVGYYGGTIHGVCVGVLYYWSILLGIVDGGGIGHDFVDILGFLIICLTTLCSFLRASPAYIGIPLGLGDYIDIIRVL